jgi:hypothetical protein
MFLGGASTVADGPTDDSDWIAPYLGLNLLEAEDLQSNLEIEPEEAHKRSPLPSGLPFWARLLPDLTLALQYRRAKERVSATAGWDRQRDGFILLVWASFPLPEELSPPQALLTVGTTQRPRRALAAAEVWEEPQEATGNSTVSEERTEPSVQELQRAAERASATPLSDIAGWGARARTASLLPELTLDYRRNVGEIDTLGIRSDLGIDSHNIEDITRYGVRATWQLNQIVFNRDELAAAQTADVLEHARRELLIEVARLYYQRRALQAELRALPAPEPPRRAQLTRDVGQTEAQLDALTGGFLSRQLGRATP